MNLSKLSNPFKNSDYTVGVDLTEIGRFQNIDPQGRFAKSNFTEKELENCQKKQNPAASLAARFAAKEAIRKCLKKSIKFNRIEITNLKDGRPQAKLLETELSKKYRPKISLTHDGKYAVAICLISIKKNKWTFKKN